MHCFGDQGSHPCGHGEACLRLSSVITASGGVLVKEILCGEVHRPSSCTRWLGSHSIVWWISESTHWDQVSVKSHIGVVCVQGQSAHFQPWPTHAISQVYCILHCIQSPSRSSQSDFYPEGGLKPSRWLCSFIGFSAYSLSSWDVSRKYLAKFCKATSSWSKH